MTLIEKLRRQIEILEKNEQRLSPGPLSRPTPVHQDGWAAPSKSASGPSQDSLISRLERLREFQQRKICEPNGFEFREETEPDLGGEIRKTAAGSFLYFSNQSECRSEERDDRFSSSGELVLSLVRLLIGSEIECEPFQVAFLDTEATGLSGGAGTYAFLVGVGGWHASGFCVEQFFMRDFHEETALLLALQERLTEVRLLVTFNGKSFDLPLLDSRYVISRLDRPLAQVTHLDLLHPARRLWKLRLGDCSLINLEKRLLGLWRENDVPGNLIPHLYFNYTRTGVGTGLRAILEHNRQDIQSLADLTLLVGRILLDDDAKEDLEPEELLSAAKYLQALGQPSLSLEFNQTALQRTLPQGLRIEAMQRSARLFKTQKIYSQAVALWEGMISDSQEFQDEACENLAIYFEHRARDLAKALDVTEYAIDRMKCEEHHSEPFASLDLSRWLHRRDRLRRKSRNKAFVWPGMWEAPSAATSAGLTANRDCKPETFDPKPGS